jgi:nucleoside diphosphate kinase
MAQTTVPVYLSGKLGSMVYTGNRQGTAVRMLVTPKNPETAGQTAQRQRFSAAAKAWAAISNCFLSVCISQPASTSCANAGIGFANDFP